MTKIDEKHPDFVGKVLCSRGIGAGYTKTEKGLLEKEIETIISGIQ